MEKVLFLRSNPVNPDSRVEKEMDALLQNGYEVHVLGWDRDENYGLQEHELTLKNGIAKCYRIGIKAQYGSGLKNIKFLAKFQLIILKFLILHKDEYDCIHACDFDTAFTAYHVINHKRTKFVYDIFDYYVDAMSVPGVLRPLIAYMDRRVINRADATIICSEQRVEQIQPARPRKLAVIHNSPSLCYRENGLNIPEKIMKIAYFGILCAEGRMIRALLDVVANNQSYELHIGGFGELDDEVESYSRKHNNIFYYGRTPYSEVLHIEKECHVLTAIYDPMVTNHYYAAPNKFYEALMLGKPLVMVKGTGMSKVVEEHGVGVLIDYNAESLKKGLDELWNKRSQWQKMAVKMKALYSAEYSWDLMEHRLLELYRSLK